MGLLDVLNGMQSGPRGQQGPSTSSGGMSPITMAVLGLLAYKALKSFGGQPGAGADASGHTAAPAAPGSNMNVGGGMGDLLKSGLGGLLPGQSASAGGGLGDFLKGGLGGLLAGGAAGGLLSGGLNDLLKQFQQSGQGEVANSWVGTGPNKAISPNDLAKALGADQIKGLMAHSGMSRDELLAGLSQHLPNVINHLTPDGRVPTEQEMSRAI